MDTKHIPIKYSIPSNMTFVKDQTLEPKNIKTAIAVISVCWVIILFSAAMNSGIDILNLISKQKTKLSPG
jgi:hypothetical protein